MALASLDGAEWLNPPPAWRRDEAGLHVTTGGGTDFWRGTHYGFIRDSGHFLGAPAPGSFTAELTFAAEWQALYDQAGVMLRIGPEVWLKAGVEISDGQANASVVVTRGLSDWSTLGLGRIEGPQTIRLTRTGGAVILHVRVGDRWQLLRLADFPEGPAQLGVMACTPERAGLAVRFLSLDVRPVEGDPLHL